MMLVTHRHVARLLVGATVLSTLAAAGHALGATTDPTSSAATDATAAPASTVAPTDTTAAPPPPAMAPPPEPVGKPYTSPALGIVEHLSPDAFPNSPVRGIPGGSLKLVFPGIQWPYIPHPAVGISGSAWIDTGYESLKRGSDPILNPNTTYFVQQGRFLLRVTPTWSDGKWFVQGQAELVADRDQQDNKPLTATADDVWLKAGKWKTFDVQIGRYYAWEVYHWGMGLDLFTLERQGAQDGTGANVIGQGPVPIYGVTNLYYPFAAIGQASMHLYPTEWLRFEMEGVFGNAPGGFNEIGGRPVAIADFGWVKAKVGAEWDSQTQPNQDAKGKKWEYGWGGALQFVVDPYIEFGVNYGTGASIAYSTTDGNRDPRGSFENYSVGGFINGRIVEDVVAGFGLNYSYKVDDLYDPSQAALRKGDFDQWQGFVALQYHLFKKVFIKAVGGYALSDINYNSIEASSAGPPHSNTMYSGRVRALYLF